MLDASLVESALDPETLVNALALDGRLRGRAWRMRTCPACGERTKRDGAAIYLKQGAWRWTHHGHGCGGGLLDLVAAVERIDRSRDFVRLVRRGAELAGIVADDPNASRIVAERRAARDERERKIETERLAAVADMPRRWEALDRRSLEGERYLAGRGIDPAALRAQGDMVRFARVRFDPEGEMLAVAVAVRDLTSGAITGIQYRGTVGKAFRGELHSQLEGAAMVGRLAVLDRDGVDVAVVVEGVADALAATLAWPGCAVFGAPGAGRIEEIAEIVAPRVRATGGWLLLVPDDDEPDKRGLRVGVDRVVDAIEAAADVGLVLDRDLQLVDLGAHHDLADAWRAGWRWRWATGGAA